MGVVGKVVMAVVGEVEAGVAAVVVAAVVVRPGTQLSARISSTAS
jgi:hypothetical protein